MLNDMQHICSLLSLCLVSRTMSNGHCQDGAAMWKAKFLVVINWCRDLMPAMWSVGELGNPLEKLED